MVEADGDQDAYADVYQGHLHLKKLPRFVLGDDVFCNNYEAYEQGRLSMVKLGHTILENHPRRFVLYLPSLRWP